MKRFALLLVVLFLPLAAVVSCSDDTKSSKTMDEKTSTAYLYAFDFVDQAFSEACDSVNVTVGNKAAVVSKNILGAESETGTTVDFSGTGFTATGTVTDEGTSLSVNITLTFSNYTNTGYDENGNEVAFIIKDGTSTISYTAGTPDADGVFTVFTYNYSTSLIVIVGSDRYNFGWDISMSEDYTNYTYSESGIISVNGESYSFSDSGSMLGYFSTDQSFSRKAVLKKSILK